ncbi:MAG: hypothetical protein CM15mP49_03860 [Actinomycetota bacterium]|nr:MAG: hypothetical protein CM15mP49_03860 [Actinomycetota bacterium]
MGWKFSTSQPLLLASVANFVSGLTATGNPQLRALEGHLWRSA